MDDAKIHRWTFVVSASRDRCSGMRFGVASGEQDDSRAWGLRLRDGVLTMHDASDGREVHELEKMRECALLDHVVHPSITCEVDLAKGSLSFGVNGGPLEQVAGVLLPAAVIPWCGLYHKGDTVTLSNYCSSDGIYFRDAARLRDAFRSAHDDVNPGRQAHAGDIRERREVEFATRLRARGPDGAKTQREIEWSFRNPEGKVHSPELFARYSSADEQASGIRTSTGLRATRGVSRAEDGAPAFPKSTRQATALVKKVQRQAQCAEIRASMHDDLYGMANVSLTGGVAFLH